MALKKEESKNSRSDVINIKYYDTASEVSENETSVLPSNNKPDSQAVRKNFPKKGLGKRNSSQMKSSERRQNYISSDSEEEPTASKNLKNATTLDDNDNINSSCSSNEIYLMKRVK